MKKERAEYIVKEELKRVMAKTRKRYKSNSFSIRYMPNNTLREINCFKMGIQKAIDYISEQLELGCRRDIYYSRDF